MRYLLLFFFMVEMAATAGSQDLRSSLLQYQFNALPLNPAYAGKSGVAGFEAIYNGNFASGQQLSRSALVSVHGPGGADGNIGWGGVFQFHKQDFYGELNVRPAFSKTFHLPTGKIAFGATLGLSYFDVDESALTVINSSFISVDGGVGVYYYTDQAFVGVSVLNVFEKGFFYDKDLDDYSLSRTNPFNLHAGSVFRLNEDLYLKPVVLLRYANVYGLPQQNSSTSYTLWSADVHVSVVVQDTYVIGLLGGFTRPQQGFDQSRVGVSATLLFGNFRLGYAIQYNNNADSSVSLPASHMLSAGYDFNVEENAVRLF